MADSSTVTTEPKSRRKEIEEFVRDLDPLQVSGNNNSVHDDHAAQPVV